MKFSDYFYYDETSPSGLRWLDDTTFGKYSQSKHKLKDRRSGSLNLSTGYWQVSLSNKLYKCHRIVWELHYGTIPLDLCIDHINGERGDNTIENLRLVSEVENHRNCKTSTRNKSGIKGVCLTSNGKGNDYWLAFWTELNGKYKSVRFSVAKYGYELAFSKAAECRENAIKNLQQNGAGYSDRHLEIKGKI